MKTIGVIIARLQTPHLQPGHRDLFNSVLARHKNAVLLLGVTEVKGSSKNPLDFPTRKKMVNKEFPEIKVLPLPDFRNDEAWSQALDALLMQSFPGEQFELYGSRENVMLRYTGNNPVNEIIKEGDKRIKLDTDFLGDQVLDTEDFRQGIRYAYKNLYPKVYATVDIALFRNANTELLLGKRKVEGKWRLPGGFSDPDDANYEAAALRELHEECGAVDVSAMLYEKSFKIDDWRYRNETDKIITSLFSTALISGIAEGNDDIDEVCFFSLKKIDNMRVKLEIVEEHFPLIDFLLQKYNS